MDACLAKLQQGNTLGVWRLDRLGRSMHDSVQLIEDLRNRGVGFRSVSDGLIDTTSPSGELHPPAIDHHGRRHNIPLRHGLNSRGIAKGEGRSEMGELAGVLINKAEGKYASADDLRRSFGTRWASRVKPATLQLLMRHRSIETTMKYYNCQDSDDVADELWAEYEAAQRNGADADARKK